MEGRNYYNGNDTREAFQAWNQAEETKTSSSLLSASIYSYPYFVEEDLETPNPVPKTILKDKSIEKSSVKNKVIATKRIRHYPSSPSTCLAQSQHSSKLKQSSTQKIHKPKPPLYERESKPQKKVISESSIRKVAQYPKKNAIQLAQILKANKTLRPEQKSSLKTSISIKQSSPLKVASKQKSLQNYKKIGPKISEHDKVNSLKVSKSCVTCEATTKKVSDVNVTTIAKITLNENDRGVFVPFSWLEKFNAEEIRLKIIKKELSRIPKPVGTDSKFYKSRQSTLICSIAKK